VAEKDLFSLVELRSWLAGQGIERSREELQRRTREGQFGRKVGQQYVVTLAEAQALLERLRQQES